MSEGMIDKAKEKLRDAAERVRDPAPPNADDGDRETERRAAAAMGGTPDVPVETEEDLEREADTDPTRPGP
jgi:hypothetical protein